MDAPSADRLPYRYESRGRTPANLVLLAVGIAMIALAWVTEAGQLIYLPLGAFAAMQLYLFARDPRAGMDIDAETVAIWRGRRRQAIPVAEIDRVEIKHWSESTDVIIHRRDGNKVDVPARCAPRLGAMKRALKCAGVNVTEG